MGPIRSERRHDPTRILGLFQNGTQIGDHHVVSGCVHVVLFLHAAGQTQREDGSAHVGGGQESVEEED